MAPSAHTYGTTCHLGPSVAFTGSKGDDDIPALKAHYFYSSPQPIDDPLSVVPIPTGADSKSANHPPRPFSPYDNKALEEAWAGVTAGKDKKSQGKRKSPSPPAILTRKFSGASADAIALSNEDDFGRHKKDGIHSGEASGSANLTNFGGQMSSVVATKAEKYKKKAPRSEAAASTTNPAELSGQMFSGVVSSKGSEKQRKPLDKSGDKTSAATSADKSESSRAKGADTTSVCGLDELDRTSPEECHTINVQCAELSEGQEPGEGGEPAGGDGASSPKKQSKKEKRSKASRKDKSSNVRGLAADSQEQTSEQQGNPHNPTCDDSHHAPFDAGIGSCCVEFEKGKGDHAPCIANKGTIESPHNENQPSSKDSRTSKGKQKVGEAQGDAANERESAQELSMLNGKGDPPLKAIAKAGENMGLAVQHSETGAENLPAQADVGLTGRPFVKMMERSSEPPVSAAEIERGVMAEGEPSTFFGIATKGHEREPTDAETVNLAGCKSQKNNKSHAEVPVGISRLHMVTLPALQMKPIYWSPVHDIAAVTRGTWFYRDTMYPVEPPVANQLELGYRELRPWSQTWSDELCCALEVGAIGEEKIAHRLWPKEVEQQGKSRSKAPEHALYADPYCAAKCFQGEAAAEGTIEDDSEKKPTEPKTAMKKYSSAQVIYKDAQNAFILKSTLQPSAYYGRKPLAKIKKGTTVGIHVVRGFDWKAWNKLHPVKKSGTNSKAEQNAPVAGDADISKGMTCPACKAQEERQNVTDLVLVIHGIGQKLSERMESFNFTHAINGFRRSINAELANDAVQKTLRKELGGVMVLPVNWRSNLSFEDGGPKKQGDKEGESTDFNLKDITPDSIPAVRNIISDVMLDIPFYMSHHKPKMIRAAISEANRVYQLWCKNNPEFQQEGRVHIIAHSLGSAMALEILSKQPTVVSKTDPSSKKINSKHLDFNTTNLFLCGSPAGFFLLLDKGRLTPRKAQGKPGADGYDDTDKNIVGEAGTFGCLAVDNVYNIMHVNDPIAYRLNATVDPQYAASLKNAQVPSATTGFFESIGNAMRSLTPGVAAPSDLAIGQVQKPGAVARLPSQLEMEVHDFTREEIAEKKFYLVNDCGQVDWFLSSGGGPLEIQYVNMLSAHSSYWGSPDFIRFIVIEVGRKPGRNHALPNMKVAKIGRKETGRKA
ncbi:related to phosphatidic acid-preferring phospholipase A1 [Phialocephala subalpina]|uniref:Related to phosphatidic acid-preferring phospholipase A1 n=1 Tax=Phialocephala subalpina TaxID=576137 RepID=A0A1L7WGV4_9HELO|nr:related to phosphatidic acid-preferring phospholipase A1 [Phialocephala subalpina]